MKKILKIISRLRRKYILLWDGLSTKKYMKMYYKFLKKSGLNFNGKPKYIHSTVYFDGIDYSRIFLGKDIVISRDVLILCHDFALEAGFNAIGKGNIDMEAHVIQDVKIGDNCFIGARSMILPGSIIGNNCIIGAGSVVKGFIPENSIIVGNPYKIIGNTSEWATKKFNEGDFIRGKY